MAGQEVRILVSGMREAGRHVAEWDGKDELGRNAASGIYLYRLQITSMVGREIFSLSQRMALLR